MTSEGMDYMTRMALGLMPFDEDKKSDHSYFIEKIRSRQTALLSRHEVDINILRMMLLGMPKKEDNE